VYRQTDQQTNRQTLVITYTSLTSLTEVIIVIIIIIIIIEIVIMHTIADSKRWNAEF